MDKKLLGYYNYTVILTYMGMLFGFTGIICIVDGNAPSALVCLMLAAVCDMFDGTVASTMKTRTNEEKRFGIQIDSLSDVICFGVLPAVYMYEINSRSNAAFIVSAFYTLCALVRLAYYNVEEEERQDQTDEARRYHIGLPVPMSALFLPIIYELCSYFRWPEKYIGMAALVAMAVCFLLPFKMRKPALVGKICVAICGLVEFLFLFAGLGDV